MANMAKRYLREFVADLVKTNNEVVKICDPSAVEKTNKQTEMFERILQQCDWGFITNYEAIREIVDEIEAGKD